MPMANATAIAERHATRSPLACACAYASRLGVGNPPAARLLTASREGMETEHACQQSRSNTQFPGRFRSPNRVKKRAKILFPPFLRGD